MIITRERNDTRQDKLAVVSTIELGECRPPILVSRWGRVFEHFRVVATHYNRNWPGTDSNLTFAVEGIGMQNNFYGIIFMWGFLTERECYDFLSGSGPMEYHSFDQEGKPISEVRERLNMPDAYIRRYASEAAC